MAIVDMFAFAVDHPPPATVILVAGDRDYAYALSTLRLRNYKVVLITPRATSCLEACASFVVDWNVALTKTRMESNTNSVRRPYVDMEASLFDELSREVSRFGDNSTVVSAPPEDIKPRRIGPQESIRPLRGNDASITGESKFAQRSSEGTDQCTNGSDDSSVSVSFASKMPTSPRRSFIPPPSLLRGRSASIPFESVSKSSSEPSRLATERLLPPDTCLEVSDDADAITRCSVPFIPNGGEDYQSSKDEPQPSIRTGSPAVKAQPPSATSNHPVVLLHSRLAMSSTTSALSETKTISSETIVSRGDCPQKMKSVDTPIHEVKRMAAPLFRPSPAEPTVDANLTSSHCLSKGDHLPVDVLTTAKGSSPSFQVNPHGSGSGSGRNVLLASADRDSICVPAADKSSTSYRTFIPCPKANNLSVERQRTYANSVGDVPEQPPGADSLSGVSPPTLHATFDVAPGSSAAQTLTPPASSMSTDTTTEQTSREHIRRQFLPLIRQLVADRHKGILRPSRSDVAMALTQVDKNVYQHVGVTKFKHYATLAQRAGLVVLGGVEGDAWIALHRDWLGEAEKPELHFNTGTGDDSRAVDENRTSSSGKVGAGCFQPLVDILEQFHRSGVRPVLRSRVGQMLESAAYRNAGVASFKEYVTRAIEVGIVLCGGVDGYAWIRLHPDIEM